MEPILQRYPYTNKRFRFPSTPYVPYVFSRLYTSIFTFLESVEPNLQLHPCTNIRFGLCSTPYLPYDFFPPHYLHFYFFLRRWNLTSNITPTPTSYSDSPPRPTHPRIFCRLSTSILPFLEAGEHYLQRHTYTEIRSQFRSSPYLP